MDLTIFKAVEKGELGTIIQSANDSNTFEPSGRINDKKIIKALQPVAFHAELHVIHHMKSKRNQIFNQFL